MTGGQKQQTLGSDEVAYASRHLALSEKGHAGPHRARHGDRRTTTAPGGTTPNRGSTLEGMANMVLLFESEAYHAACLSIYTLKEDVDPMVIIHFFDTLAARYPKYRMFPANRGHKFSKPYWRAVEDFNPRDHVEVVGLKDGKNNEDSLFDLAGKFLSVHFDFDRPLWSAMIVKNLDGREGGRAAIMLKLHHAISDGQGMIMSYHETLHAMYESKKDKSELRPAPKTEAKTSSSGQKVADALLWLPRFFLAFWFSCLHGWHYVFRFMFQGGRRTFRYPEKKEKRTAARVYAHTRSVPMASLKDMQAAFSPRLGKGQRATINDIACALLTRSMRRYADIKYSDPNDKTKQDRYLNLFIPISVRPQGNWDLFNFSTGAFAWFDFRSGTYVSCLDQIKNIQKEMAIIKKSRLPTWGWKMIQFWLQWPFFFVPNWFGWGGLSSYVFSSYHIASNVPGPRTPIRFGDVEAISYHVLPPSSPGRESLCIGMISFVDSFSIAVAGDDTPELRDVPRGICDAFERCFNEAMEEAKQLAKGDDNV